MLDRANELMGRLASLCLDAMRAETEDWDKAYWRIAVNAGHQSLEASFVKDGKADLYDGNLDSTRPLAKAAAELWEELGKAGHPFKLLLLTLSPDGGYEIDFENRKVNRWQIRLDEGYDGIPR